MSPSTLANRFRTQRSERIRFGGLEVLSIVELAIDSTTNFEIVIEECRNDVEQGLIVHCPQSPLLIERSFPERPTNAASSASECVIAGDPDNIVEVRIEPVEPVFIQLWNAWVVDDSEQAWTGNSGIVLEEFEPPDGADRRFRLWCSDGLGDATFDDLVCVVTWAGES